MVNIFIGHEFMNFLMLGPERNQNGPQEICCSLLPSLVPFSYLFFMEVTSGRTQLLALVLSKTALIFPAVAGGGIGKSVVWKHGECWQA